MNNRVKALREEISFWESLVRGYRDKQSAEEYMRIASALALAEHRLKLEQINYDLDFESNSLH